MWKSEKVQQSQRSIRRKVYIIISQVKKRKLLKARENSGDQVAIVFVFASNWLEGWRDLSGPITEQS